MRNNNAYYFDYTYSIELRHLLAFHVLFKAFVSSLINKQIKKQQESQQQKIKWPKWFASSQKNISSPLNRKHVHKQT